MDIIKIEVGEFYNYDEVILKNSFYKCDFLWVERNCEGGFKGKIRGDNFVDVCSLICFVFFCYYV